jgi:hypothetical protein
MKQDSYKSFWHELYTVRLKLFVNKIRLNRDVLLQLEDFTWSITNQCSWSAIFPSHFLGSLCNFLLQFIYFTLILFVLFLLIGRRRKLEHFSCKVFFYIMCLVFYLIQAAYFYFLSPLYQFQIFLWSIFLNCIFNFFSHKSCIFLFFSAPLFLFVSAV